MKYIAFVIAFLFSSTLNAQAYSKGNNFFVYPSGRVSIGTLTPQAILDVSGTGTNSAMLVPRDTTANRPSAINGMVRYNSSISGLEGYSNSNWGQVLQLNTAGKMPSVDGFLITNLNVSASGGANLALSNLSSVAVNTPFIFGTGVAGGISTKATTGATASETLTIGGGSVVSGIGGGLVLNGGDASSAGVGGAVTIKTGTTSGGVPGFLNLQIYSTGTPGQTLVEGDSNGRVEFGRVGPIGGGQTASNSYVNCSTRTYSDTHTLVINMDTQGGDPSPTNPCVIGFRETTGFLQGYNEVYNDTAVGIVLSNGSSLGCTVSVPCTIYIYAIASSSSTDVLAISRIGYFDEGSLQTSIAEGGAGGADSATALYSTAAQTDKPIRIMGRMVVTPAAAFAWDSDPTEISPLPFSPVINAVTMMSGILPVANGGTGAASLSGFIINGGQTGGITVGTTDSNTITISTNGVSRISVDQLGNVGIGSSSAIYINGPNRIGIGTLTPRLGSIVDFAGSGTSLSSIIVPRDTTANRPIGPINGMMRYNTSSGAFEGYATQWTGIGESPTVQKFTSGTSQTYTTPAGAKFLKVTIIGGGGGGGGCGTGAVSACGASGGGGGGTAISWISNPAATYTYTAGAGSAGGVGNNAGTAGVNSTFSYNTMVGGGGGAGGGSGASTTPTPGANTTAVGGTSTGGDLNILGGASGPGMMFSGTLAISGGGGNSSMGGGGKGLINTTANGTAGGLYGGGGAGAVLVNGGSASNGGLGGNGVVIVEEYY